MGTWVKEMGVQDQYDAKKKGKGGKMPTDAPGKAIAMYNSGDSTFQPYTTSSALGQTAKPGNGLVSKINQTFDPRTHSYLPSEMEKFNKMGLPGQEGYGFDYGSTYSYLKNSYDRMGVGQIISPSGNFMFEIYTPKSLEAKLADGKADGLAGKIKKSPAKASEKAMDQMNMLQSKEQLFSQAMKPYQSGKESQSPLIVMYGKDAIIIMQLDPFMYATAGQQKGYGAEAPKLMDRTRNPHEQLDAPDPKLAASAEQVYGAGSLRLPYFLTPNVASMNAQDMRQQYRPA